jgi:APA family basic amino acid/polyamine antiporter
MTDQGLKRELPGKFVLAVTIGGVIGLGILRGPGEIAAVIPDPFFYLALWLIVGLFVLLSTLVAAELVNQSGFWNTWISRLSRPDRLQIPGYETPRKLFHC